MNPISVIVANERIFNSKYELPIHYYVGIQPNRYVIHANVFKSTGALSHATYLLMDSLYAEWHDACKKQNKHLAKPEFTFICDYPIRVARATTYRILGTWDCPTLLEVSLVDNNIVLTIARMYND